VFNRTQENLTKGGLHGRSANGRRQQTRPVQGIDSDVRLNRALWLLADGLRQLKARTPAGGAVSPPFPCFTRLEIHHERRYPNRSPRRRHPPRALLQAADPSKNLILVPLSRLVLRPTGRNVRKTPRMSIPELAASIQRVGLLQNLIVIPAADGEHYEVVAGGRASPR
jgi:hypothetical protein